MTDLKSLIEGQTEQQPEEELDFEKVFSEYIARVDMGFEALYNRIRQLEGRLSVFEGFVTYLSMKDPELKVKLSAMAEASKSEASDEK